VLLAIRRELPREDLLYVGDSGCAPYGDRSPAFVNERALTLTQFLLHRDAKAVVVACNTATAIAVSELRRRFEVPIVAIEPAVKPAVSRTRSGVVGVLATAATVSSANMAQLVASFGSHVKVLVQPCPGLADQVEKGAVTGSETRALVMRYVRPLIEQGADTLVLGCTHYPFLRPLIEDVAGPGVEVIDPAMAVARQLRRRLEDADVLSETDDPGTEHFWTTGPPDQVSAIVRELWGKRVEVFALTD
jgi:glutamate racemase